MNTTFDAKLIQDMLAAKNAIIASGGTSLTYQDSKDPRAFLTSEQALSALTQQHADNNNLLQRQNFMTGQITSAQKLANDLLNKIQQQRSNSPLPVESFKQTVTGMLSTLTSILNTRYLGDSLLSGVNTQHDSVRDLSQLTAVNSGTPMDISAYYSGGPGNVTIPIDQSDSIDMHPITAAHGSFAKLIYSMRLCLGAPTSNDPVLSEAYETLRDANQNDFPNALTLSGVAYTRLQQSIASIPAQQKAMNDLMAYAELDDLFSALINQQNLQASLDVNRVITLEQASQTMKFANQLAHLAG
jgi:hypothetical protein